MNVARDSRKFRFVIDGTNSSLARGKRCAAHAAKLSPRTPAAQCILARVTTRVSRRGHVGRETRDTEALHSFEAMLAW